MEQLDYMSDTRMCYLLQPKKQLSHLNEAYLGRFGCPKNRLLKRILASILSKILMERISPQRLLTGELHVFSPGFYKAQR